MHFRALSLAALALTAFVVPDGHAQSGVAELTVFGGRGTARPLRWGIGGEVTINVGPRLTLGPRYLNMWGDNDRVLAGGDTIREEDNNATIWTGEIGVRFDASGIAIRPVVGVGAALLTQTVTVRPLDGTGTGEETKETVPVFTPGVIATVPAGPIRFGGELRYISAGTPEENFSTDFESQSFIFYFRVSYVLGR
jgi:hypothetical protein